MTAHFFVENSDVRGIPNVLIMLCSGKTTMTRVYKNDFYNIIIIINELAVLNEIIILGQPRFWECRKIRIFMRRFNNKISVFGEEYYTRDGPLETYY